jgi:hypothetical protein
MILFQKEYIDDIKNGKKRFTIRKGYRGYRYKINSIHKCKTKLFSKEYFARIRIKSLVFKKFYELDEQDAKDDLFISINEMKKRLQELNGKIPDDTMMTKINFELVKE